MAANNQGISHIRLDGSNRIILCGNNRAHIAVTVSNYRLQVGGRFCSRCLSKLEKMDALASRRAQKAD